MLASNDFLNCSGGVLAPNGFIYGIPYRSRYWLKIEPGPDIVTEVGEILSNDNA